MKQTNPNTQSSSPLVQAASIDWQKQLPFLVEALLKGISSCNRTEPQQDKSVGRSCTLTDTELCGNIADAVDGYPAFTPQSQRDFETKLCELYSSKRSIAEVLEILEKEYGRRYTPEQLYQAVDHATTGYRQWRSQGLYNVYPMIWVHPQRFRVVDDKGIFTNHFLYTMLSVDQDGHKDIIGAWIPRKDPTNFWVSVFTELKNRGLSDIIYLAASNIEGLREAARVVYPDTAVIPNAALTLINMTKYVLSKDCPGFSQDIRRLWNQKDINLARSELSDMERNWDKTYPVVVNRIKESWAEIAVFYEVDNEIRQFLVSRDAYTKLYDGMRRSFARKGFFPSDETALKLAFLSANRVKEKWTAPFMNWGRVNQCISMAFRERYPLL